MSHDIGPSTMTSVVWGVNHLGEGAVVRQEVRGGGDSDGECRRR